MEREPNTSILKSPLFWIAVILFIWGGYLSFLDKTGSAFITYGAAIFCLFFVFLPYFEWIKGLGMQGKLREKINEADEIIERLKNITLPMAEMLFTLTARLGRWGSAVPRRDQHRIVKGIEKGLIEMGVQGEALETRKNTWHRFNMIDLSWPIRNRITFFLDGLINEKTTFITDCTKEKPPNQAGIVNSREEIKKIEQEKEKVFQILKTNDLGTIPGTLKEFVMASQFLKPIEIDDIMEKYSSRFEDLEYYSKHREFRDLEKWFQEEEQEKS